VSKFGDLDDEMSPSKNTGAGNKFLCFWANKSVNLASAESGTYGERGLEVSGQGATPGRHTGTHSISIRRRRRSSGATQPCIKGSANRWLQLVEKARANSYGFARTKPFLLVHTCSLSCGFMIEKQCEEKRNKERINVM